MGMSNRLSKRILLLGLAGISTALSYPYADISAGSNHFVSATAASGYVYGCGLQTNNRLGNLQTTGTASSPDIGLVSAASGGFPASYIRWIGSIATGESHTVATTLDGSGNQIVVAWGSNAFHETGNASTSNTLGTSQVYYSAFGGGLPLYNVTKVAAGNHFSGALTSPASGGVVYAWGVRTVGRLGNGLTAGSQQFADQVLTSATGNPVLGGIVDLDFGDASALALGYSGTVWSWGYNANGQLGLGSTTNQAYANQVKWDASTSVTDAIGISGGEAHSAIIRLDPAASATVQQGTVWTFGSRANGRLGDGAGTAGNATYPVEVVKADGTPLTNIVQVSAGSAHTLALDSDGHVWSWGYNGYGALGDNTNTSRAYASKVKDPTGFGELSNIVQISAGGTGSATFSIALASDGSVYTWGINTYGQLGLGSTGGTHYLPEVIPSLFNLN